MIDHLDVILSPTELQRYILQSGPATPQLYQAKWDHEIPDSVAARYEGVVSFTDRQGGTPMIFRPEPFNKVPLDQRLQWLWKSEIDIEGAGLSRDQLNQAWRWMTDHNRAYTNNVGPDILRDYVLGLRLNYDLPGIFPLITGGAVYAGNETTYNGIRSLEVAHINTDGQVPGVDSKFVYGASAISHRTHPWLIHYAVNSTKYRLANGTYLVNPWSTALWQGRNAPVPLIAREAIYYPLELMKKLPLGAPIPSPYNPPR